MSSLEQVHGTNVRTNQISNPSIFVLKEGHLGKITVYLDKIHQYLCAVKFLLRSMQY